MEIKQQEKMFIEWSQKITPETFDVARMLDLIGRIEKRPIQILDVGGGIGMLGKVIVESMPHASVDVVDISTLAKDAFLQHERLHLIFEDFLNLNVEKKYDIVIFRTLLHHVIGGTERETVSAQKAVMAKAKAITTKDGRLLITENFYEPIVFSDATGRMIYYFTRLKKLAPLIRALGANTAGEGVRFRSFKAWMEIFHSQHLLLEGEPVKEPWDFSLIKKLLLLCSDRYQAFLVLKK